MVNRYYVNRDGGVTMFVAREVLLNISDTN